VDTDRNLLFGVLALQLDLIDRDQFVQACAAWTTRKETPLADLLVERGWLTAGDRADVERLLERKLKKHSGDAHASLAAVANDGVRRVLAVLDDPAVAQSLAGLSPPDGHVLLTTVTELPETRARYTLTRLHARGGLGQVWLARDGSLGREVALKELRPERAGSPEVWARFLEEAKITGQLEHPGIVPVYELSRGPGDGSPFYTMRFVRGRTLGAAIRSYHDKRQAGQAGPLDQQALLQAFVGVCNAVAYAHSRGVVHRDLKPQNVVLGDFGEVIVLDWGLAKLVGRDEAGDEAPPVVLDPGTEHEATVQGQVLGTPAYMAPEQAEGRLDLIDRRTDVYGLGAILYELLTGRPPFAGKDSQDVLRRVREEEPERPRRLWPRAPAALEAVCLKALTKRREQRYATAGELAEEVRRFLADEPVTAYREPWGRRAGHWVKRHRPLVAGSAAAVLVAAVSLAVATAFLMAANDRERAARQRAEDSEREAGLRRDEAQTQRDRAEANFKLAHQAVDQYLTKVSTNTLLNQPGMQPLRKELLTSALPFYQRFVEERQGQLAARFELAEAYERLGYITYEAGSWAKALPFYQKAAALLEELRRANRSEKDYARRLSVVYRQLALVCHLNNQADAAERYMKAAQDLSNGLDGDRRRQLNTLLSQAALWVVPNQAARAEEGYRKALKLAEDLTAANPGDPELQQWLGAACVGLGQACQAQGRLPEAEPLVQRGEAIFRQLAVRYPTVLEGRRYVGIGLTMVGEFYRTTNQPAKAIAVFEEARAYLQAVADKNPALNDVQVGLATCADQLGRLYGDAGKPEQALAAFGQAVAAVERLVARQPEHARFKFSLVEARTGRAQVLLKLARYREALADFDKALALAVPFQQAAVHVGRAITRAYLGEYDAAVEEAQAVAPGGTAPVNLCYDLACVYAVASAAVRKDTKLPAAERDARSARHAAHALAFLAKAKAGGVFRDPAAVANLKKDHDLDPLRPRPDFQKFLADLEAKPGP
jgi:serine/threonine-protein kinase